MEVTTRPGRTSVLAGKMIVPLTTHNSRRVGSTGWQTVNILLRHPQGIKTERLERLGGRLGDVHYEIKAGRAKVVDAASQRSTVPSRRGRPVRASSSPRLTAPTNGNLTKRERATLVKAISVLQSLTAEA